MKKHRFNFARPFKSSLIDRMPKIMKTIIDADGSFFLTGLIWARTVFCIDMGNIVYRNMVKIHLPHMYMIFVECYRKQILCSTDLQYCTKLFNTFRIRSALSSLSLQTLWVRCSFFRNTFFFFWL